MTKKYYNNVFEELNALYESLDNTTITTDDGRNILIEDSDDAKVEGLEGTVSYNITDEANDTDNDFTYIECPFNLDPDNVSYERDEYYGDGWTWDTNANISIVYNLVSWRGASCKVTPISKQQFCEFHKFTANDIEKINQAVIHFANEFVDDVDLNGYFNDLDAAGRAEAMADARDW